MEDYVVVGAGLAGAAAAWHLASRGEHVTVVERSTPGNAEGSSHGSARIFRYAYPSEFYTGLVARAKAGWDELERQHGSQLLRATGALDFGPVRNAEYLATVLDRCGVENELLTARDAESRWPQMRFDTSVLWHPGAGVLDSIRAIESMLELALAAGRTRLLLDWDVARVEKLGNKYTLRSTSDAVIEASRIVVTAGGWLPHLLARLDLPLSFLAGVPKLVVRQEQAHHFPYRQAAKDDGGYPDWPTFIYKGHTIETFGLPGGRDAEFRGQKVALNGGRIMRSALDQDGVVDATNRRRVVEYVTHYLPGVAPEPYAESTCLFTNTPSGNFLIDRVDGITIVSACCGMGAKFAPLLGEFAADLATGQGEVPAEFRVAGHSAEE